MLVRHLAGMEHFWFRQVLAGEDVQRLYRAADGKADDFSGAVPDPAVVAEAWAAWRAAVDSPTSSRPGSPTLGSPLGSVTVSGERVRSPSAQCWCT